MFYAGAGKFNLKLADISPEDWAWHMSTNVNSVFYLTQLAIPHLEATKGSIVNISSIAGGPACEGMEHCEQVQLVQCKEEEVHLRR